VCGGDRDRQPVFVACLSFQPLFAQLAVMNILFIADPLDHFKIYKDSTYAMMAEAARRGHAIHACEPLVP
jgi:hypothetical protein